MTDNPLGDNPNETLLELNEQIVTDPDGVYKKLFSINSIDDFADAPALNIIGLLVDASGDTGKKDGINHAIDLAEELLDRDLPPGHRSRIHYDLGNAFSHLRRLNAVDSGSWWWENDDLEQEIYHFRMALDPDGIAEIRDIEACKTYTNLGNALSEVGRVVEAIRCWNHALEIDPAFAQAKGQKGIGFHSYARAHYDNGHTATFLRAAYEQLDEAVAADGLFPPMKEYFEGVQQHIADQFKPGVLDEEMEFEEYSLGDSDEEKKYRQWCLEQTLFLNPLNDLGANSIAAQDILHLGSVSGEESSKIVSCVGFYNQMKQEYVSARYLLYEGLYNDEPHFSDKDVRLENTLDYPVYSFNAEKVRIAMRMAYSLFDKIASFIQYYFDLSHIPSHKLNFGNVWYKSQGRNKLAPAFDGHENWALRGLFWLSKDLEFFSEMYVESSMDPGAKELRDTRNELEHGYLKLHEPMWVGPDAESRLRDDLAISLYRSDFEELSLKSLRKARSALIYLSLAIQREEQAKNENLDDDEILAPVRLGRWEDEWKR